MSRRLNTRCGPDNVLILGTAGRHREWRFCVVGQKLNDTRTLLLFCSRRCGLSDLSWCDCDEPSVRQQIPKALVGPPIFRNG